MKRWIVLAVLALITAGAFAPAQADVPDRTPIVFVCAGTAGYAQTSQGPRWKARAQDGVPVVLPNTCFAVARDTAKPFAVPDPPPQVDPTDPINQGSILEAYTRTYAWAYYTLYGLDDSSPVNRSAYMFLSGVGDFACGAGTLAHDGDTWYANQLWHGNHFSDWDLLDWTATFSNGVGQITGTAVGPYGGADWYPAPQQRTLSGTIVVSDGAAYGQCNDSAGASRFVAILTLS